MTEKLNVYQRINKVREENDYIKKDKSVDGQYMVVTHDQVTHELRADLIKHGIVIEPYLVSERVVQDTLMRAGAKQNPIIRLECVFDVFFVNMDDPKDRACARVPAHALDTGDKAPGKATSYAVKTAVLKIFSIETGEEDEARKETENTGGGLDEKAFVDWVSAISEIGGKTEEEIDTNAQKVYDNIIAACSKVKDRASATKLRTRLTNRVAALKKGLKK